MIFFRKSISFMRKELEGKNRTSGEGPAHTFTVQGKVGLPSSVPLRVRVNICCARPSSLSPTTHPFVICPHFGLDYFSDEKLPYVCTSL